jgi:IclR family transcriptional regulator, KDG regulon repressor
MSVAMRKDKSSYIIQNVSQALVLLEQFKGGDAELGVTELSKRLALQKNNVFRLLATLEARNFIEQNSSTGGYRLGLKNLELGQATARQTGLQALARPVLESLAARLNETVYLAVLKDTCVVLLDELESTRPVRAVSRRGAWLPLHCTAAGKVLLSALSETEQFLRLPANLERYTGRTVTEAEELRLQLQQVAERGYAVESEEFEGCVCSLSAPIRNGNNTVVAALAISGPVMRFGAERLADELLPALRQAAAEISARLGYCD